MLHFWGLQIRMHKYILKWLYALRLLTSDWELGCYKMKLPTGMIMIFINWLLELWPMLQIIWCDQPSRLPVHDMTVRGRSDHNGGRHAPAAISCWVTFGLAESPILPGQTQSPRKTSAIGWLLFMRCVSLTFTGLFLRWTPVETFEALLAKLLSGCDSATCLTTCKAMHSNICEILKKTVLL